MKRNPMHDVHLLANALHGPAARPMSLLSGGATTLRGRFSQTEPIAANDIVVFAFNPAGGHIVLARLTRGVGNSWISINTLSGNMYTPAPDTFCPTRGTMGLRDVTKQLDLGGVVRVLQLPQSIVTSTTPAIGTQDDIINFVRSHPKTKIYGRDLSIHDHYWYSHMVDPIKANSFEAMRTTLAEFLGELDDPRFNTTVVLFEAYTQARSFEFTVGVTAYARYPAIGPLAAMEHPIPHLPHEKQSSANRMLQELGSAANVIGDGIIHGLGTAATAAAKAWASRTTASAVERAAGSLL